MAEEKLLSAKSAVKRIQTVLNCSREAAIRRLEVAIQNHELDMEGVNLPPELYKHIVIDRHTLMWKVPLSAPSRA